MQVQMDSDDTWRMVIQQAITIASMHCAR